MLIIFIDEQCQSILLLVDYHDEIDGLDVKTIQKDNPEGYTLEADLECPKSCTICILIIHLLLKGLKLKKVCYQIISKILEINILFQ